MIYVRDIQPDGGWRDVFLADTTRPEQTTVYFAREGRIRLDEEKRIVQLELRDGTSHTTHARPARRVRRERVRHDVDHQLDPETDLPRPPAKGRTAR